MSILTSWSPFFQPVARMRGRGYQASDRVERIEPVDGELIRALVRGSEEYTVTIRREEARAVAECTCPGFASGRYCKHIWATLLDVQQNPEGPGCTPGELAGLRVRAPKARKRASEAEARSSSRSASEPEWVGRLSLLRPPSYEMEHGAGDGLPGQRQVCYVVLPEASRRHHSLVVELRQRTPIATGWSKSKPLKINADVLPGLADPEDRKLCALLLGASEFDDQHGGPTFGGRTHATYRLPSGGWRTLLERMIRTGRCFVETGEDDDSGEEEPLRWDEVEEPWVLWMVGREVEEELQISVELRRGEQRLGVEEPKLLLGGPDGLLVVENRAAWFDDREAFRWASQFRDDYRRHEEPRPIRVPKGDVDRFLDRLYMMPQLPEIDLPAGVGRTPEHVTPVPQVELFGPESSEGAKLLPASAKNHVVGRVSFVYEDQRVSPAQPGRFVAISSSASSGEGVSISEEVDSGQLEEALEGVEEALTDAAAGSANGRAEVSSNGNGHAVGEADEAEATEDEASEGEEAGEAEPASLANAGRLIRRDHRGEREALALLAGQGFRPLNNAGADTMLLPQKMMGDAVAALLGRGWQVSADQRAVRHAGAPNLTIHSEMDWFELRGGIQYQRDDGQVQEVPLPEILAAMRSGTSMITLDDGSQGLLPEDWLAEHQLLTSLGKAGKDHLRFKTSQVAVLDALLDEQELAEVDERFEQLRQRLREFEGIQEVEPHPAFKGELRPYQREGLGWFEFLRTFGFGGVLADDMGLGKTIQVLAMLDARGRELREAAADGEAGGARRPSLVVAPRSVVFNWMDEAERFTPDLRVQVYAGTDREALRESFQDYDLIVTSYGLLRRDVEALGAQAFDYVVLDEAQAIKNPGAQAAKAARVLEANHRLALTGTPVENHLGDLWSIFEFLNPGMLGSSAKFGEIVKSNGNGASAGPQKPEVAEQVGRLLRPFILRRTKRQVLDDLPEKTEQTIVCEMEPAQQKIYDELRDYYRQQLMSKLDVGGGGDAAQGLVGGKAGFMVLEALLRLRQAACHPGMINEQHESEPAAKLDVLLELLADVIEEDSKALIFSQFTSMLGLVRQKLEERGIKYCYLDGQTRNRREVVQRFQDDDSIPVFLISLKTGGFGLNLTAAEYVFILDPWWNPAVEQQAIDRTHRIGQTQRVFAYRLICQDTVEQRITQLQAKKREIAEAIVGGEQQVLQQLTKDDLEELLS